MRIETYRVPGHFDGRECFVHARACHIGGGEYVMTLQKLDVSGSDLFSPLYASYSSDGGALRFVQLGRRKELERAAARRGVRGQDRRRRHAPSRL